MACYMSESFLHQQNLKDWSNLAMLVRNKPKVFSRYHNMIKTGKIGQLDNVAESTEDKSVILIIELSSKYWDKGP